MSLVDLRYFKKVAQELNISNAAGKLNLAVADPLLKLCLPGRYPECKETFREGIFLKDFLHFPVILYPRQNRIHTEIHRNTTAAMEPGRTSWSRPTAEFR